jgi:ribosomal protein RSM22 (predicted rRNA methylase)
LIRYLDNPKYKGNLKLALANTSNGRKILTNDEEVDAYIALYGAYHYYKLHSAFDTLDISKFRGKKIEILTYGSGPATETCVLIDYLISKNIDLAIKRITLIEPSFTSLQRGEQYVKSTFITSHRGLEIKAINKTLEFLNTNDVNSKTETVKLHIFSNILDVEQVDLNSLAILLKNSQKGANYFICVSPNSSSAKQRLDKFYHLMSELFQISNISVNADCVKGRLWLMTQGRFVDMQIDKYQRIFMTYAS